MSELAYDAALSYPRRRGGYWCVWQYPENRVVITLSTKKGALDRRTVKAEEYRARGWRVLEMTKSDTLEP